MNAFSRKLQALARIGMVRFLAAPLSLYVVNEYPKSGGTWVGAMLGRVLDIPFPKNRLPAFRSSVMHGHYLNPWGIRNVVVVWRDGRDVMASWYHHCLFVNEHNNERLVRRTRKELSFSDYEDVRANLPEFIEYAFTRQAHPRFSWSDFVRRWYSRKGVCYVYYEDLHKDAAKELQRIFFELTGNRLSSDKATATAEQFSFSRLSGRKPGEESKGSFMRKGIVGDWRNNFSPDAREVFDHYAGNELLLLGYEQDRTWVRGDPLR
jgi:Sulfotransferase domain